MKGLKFLAIALVVVVALLGIGVAVVHTVDFDHYKPVIEKQVSEATGREFHIAGDSDLKLSLMPSLVLRDVSLANAPWGSQAHMLRVGQAELRLALLPLLQGRIEVRRLILVDPDIVLETDADSTGNWVMGGGSEGPQGPEPAEEAASEGIGIDVALYEIRLDNARLRFHDGVAKRDTALTVKELSIERNEAAGRLEWNLAALLNDIPLSVSGTTGYLSDLLNDRPFRSEMSGTLGNVRFAVEETVARPLEASELHVKARIEAPDLQTLSGLAGTELPPVSPIRLEGEINDAGDAYQVRLQGKAADIQLALNGTVGKALDGTGMDIDYSVESQDLKTISAIAGTELPQVGPLKASGKAAEADGFYGLTTDGALADLSFEGRGRIARSLEQEGMTGTLKVEAPNLQTVSKLAKTEIPDGGPLQVEADLTDTGKTYTISLRGAVGDVKLTTNGSIADSLDGKDLDLTLALKAPDLKVLGGLGATELPPVGPVEVKARVHDIPGGYKVSGLEARIGDSDLSGEASVVYPGKPMRVSARLASRRLDLSPFEKEKPAPQKAAKHKAGKQGKPSGERVFSDEPLSFNKLAQVDADVRFKAKALETRTRDLRDVALGLKIQQGKLAVKPMQARTANGVVRGDIALDASKSRPTIDIRLDGNDVVLGDIKGLKGVITDGRTMAKVALRGAGRSLHEIMAGLDGEIVVDVGKGELDSKAVNLIGADVIVQLLDAINPFDEKTSKTPVDCAVLRFDITDGVAKTDRGIVLETDRMFVIGNGQIDLDSEKIDIAIRTQARQGVGINVGDVSKAVGLGGTLAHPVPALDVKGAAVAGATVGAAVMTMGLSYAAQKGLEAATKDRTPCLTALGKAPAAKAQDKGKPPVGKARTSQP
jgi:uncharacterized protein involved in outer membrane biogenesis